MDGVLHIGDVELIARGFLSVDHQVEVRLAEDSEHADVLNARNRAHDVDDFIAAFFQNLEIVAVDFDGELAFHAADRFLHVVGDGLGEIPDHAGDLVELAAHGADELLFVLAKHRAPLLAGLQIDEILGVGKAGGIGTVVGAADLAGGFRHLRKRCQNDPNLVGEAHAFRWAGAGRKRSANPHRAFVEVRQEFAADVAGEP